MKFLDQVFQMEQGYVLDFSDRTIGIFFDEELNIDIFDPSYTVNGTSKAKRLAASYKLSMPQLQFACLMHCGPIEPHSNRPGGRPRAFPTHTAGCWL